MSKIYVDVRTGTWGPADDIVIINNPIDGDIYYLECVASDSDIVEYGKEYGKHLDGSRDN